MLIAHKIKLLPTPEQAALFRRCETVAKATYNQALRMWQEDYQRYLREMVALCGSRGISALTDSPRCLWPRFKKRSDLEKELIAAGVAKDDIPATSGFRWISKHYANRPAHWEDLGYWPGAGKITNLKDAANHFFKDGFGYPRPIKEDDVCGFLVLSSAEKCGGKKDANGRHNGPFARHVDRPVWQRPLEFNVPKIGKVRMAEPLRFEKFETQKKISPRGKNEGQEIETFPVASVTISRNKAGDWFASILCSVPEIEPNAPVRDYKVGVDLGIKTLAKLSDEVPGQPDRFPARKALSNAERRLLRLERKMSRQQAQAARRKRKLSECKNYQKTKRLHALAWKKVGHRRESYSHQLTTVLVRDYPVIGIEDLGVKGMMRKGKPGNKPKKARLNRAIGDAGFGRFRIQLEYKAKWHRREVHYTPQFEPTSKVCNQCGWKNEKLKLSDRQWRCGGCETIHDRDLNAALNICRKSVPKSSDDPSVAGKDEKDVKSGSAKSRRGRFVSRKSEGDSSSPFDPGAVDTEQSVVGAPNGQKALEEATGHRRNNADFSRSSGFKSRLDGY
ncbi:MAG: transposase [Planctomycetes bacterium]|nr:transposase [Planctomycetota bacterium]MCL4729498.1 transposase [Planctomycetota bacterium]